jgi:hypothetical protein
VGGISSGLSLASGQTLQFRVTFHPSTAGSSSATLSVSGSGLTAPVQLALSGASTTSNVGGPTTTPAHSVHLTWQGSTSSVAGYHVYRGQTSGGPYNRVSSSTITALDYTDATVQSGAHYYYVVTALDSAGNESAFSNEAGADVPNP